MIDVILLVGKLLPEEKIIEEIKEEATKWLLVPSEEQKQKLCSMCMLLLSKEATNGKNIVEVAAQLEKSQRIQERIQTEKL